MSRVEQDVVVVGGGVIGLSLAWRLARDGATVRLLERGRIGREASWAGAGILPPATVRPGQHPLEQLAGLSQRLHRQWAAELLEWTGVDTEYRPCGGVYLARTPGEAAALRGLAWQWDEEGIELQRLDAAGLGAIHPQLQQGLQERRLRGAWWAPQECRLRNPRHLQALRLACERSGVLVETGVEVLDWQGQGDRVQQLLTSQGPRTAAAFCLTAGAWTGNLLRRRQVANGILPIRGQMVLFGPGATSLTAIVNEGSRYLVPRDDGRLLAGSTEEEAGFDRRTTVEAIEDLKQLAWDLLPELRTAPVEATWAGFRPGVFDSLPYLGRLRSWSNMYVAAGHFRSGLFLSPATAEVMSQLIRGENPQVDLTPFHPERG